MPEKRNITKEDILLKARLLAEGVRYQVKGPSLWKPPSRTEWYPTDISFASPVVVLDGSDVVCATRPNPRSRMEVVMDGNNVTILDMGEVVGTGTLEARAPWLDTVMSDGTRIDTSSFETIAHNIIISSRCASYDSGKGCKYCGLFAAGFPQTPLSFNEQLELTKSHIRATVVALENSWRGIIQFVGGATLPDRRDQWTTDLLEAAMALFHESVDEDTLNQCQIAPSVYPPNDLGHFDKWKSFGINSVDMDGEVGDPAYFKAICPGKGDQQRWLEAQEAAVEVFGRGRGCASAMVAGIEPMAGMLEGIEERVSKGVFPVPIIFRPELGAPMDRMQPPSAEWFVEAGEKMADIYFKYGDTFDIPLTEDDRWGYTRRGRSYYWSPFDDERSRRLQEMGKLPPGLPKQDGIELA